jgi:hypothetical protein
MNNTNALLGTAICPAADWQRNLAAVFDSRQGRRSLLCRSLQAPPTRPKLSACILPHMCCIVNYETVNRPWQERMLTKDILFGLNLLTLAGFAVMGLSLTLQRSGQIGAPLSIGLMSVGTALVVYGLYARGENG